MPQSRLVDEAEQKYCQLYNMHTQMAREAMIRKEHLGSFFWQVC